MTATQRTPLVVSFHGPMDSGAACSSFLATCPAPISDAFSSLSLRSCSFFSSSFFFASRAAALPRRRFWVGSSVFVAASSKMRWPSALSS